MQQQGEQSLCAHLSDVSQGKETLEGICWCRFEARPERGTEIRLQIREALLQSSATAPKAGCGCKSKPLRIWFEMDVLIKKGFVSRVCAPGCCSSARQR